MDVTWMYGIFVFTHSDRLLCPYPSFLVNPEDVVVVNAVRDGSIPTFIKVVRVHLIQASISGKVVWNLLDVAVVESKYGTVVVLVFDGDQ